MKFRIQKNCVIIIYLLLIIPLIIYSADDFYKNIRNPKELDPQLALIGPSRVKTEQPIELHLVALGKDGNPCNMPTLPIVTCEGPCNPLSQSEPKTFDIPFKQIREGIYHLQSPPELSKEGYYLFKAKDSQGIFLPFGLPVYVSKEKPPLQLYWADLHGHSTLSDGALSPEEYYTWARDVACLDAIALTDHNWALNEQRIEKIRQLSKKWYEPGKFAPLFAFEWAVGEARPQPARGRPDHKNLYFRSTEEQFIPWALWHNTPTVAKLWEILEGHDVIAIPHHTGLPHNTSFGTDWSLHNEKFERLAEIFSDWGSSELAEDRYQLPEFEKGNFIRDAIAQGYHLGFVGGSDTHTTRPGLNTIPAMGHAYALTALTAIESPELTRDSLWTALYNRRCYATSGGRRILLDFSVNGAPMGSRIIDDISSPSRKVEATVAGPCNIKEIIIVKNANQVASFPGKGWCQKIEWIDKNPSQDKEDSYYIRAEMEDTSMVWSSPVWIAGTTDPDIAIEPRLWRLDGDVSNRNFRISNVEGSKITSQNPLTLCEIEGSGAIDRISIESLVGASEDIARSSVLSIFVDGESKPSIETCLDQFCFVAMGGKPFATRGVAFNSTNRKDGQCLTFVRDLRIPFANSCRVQLSPQPNKTLPYAKAQITYGMWQKNKMPQLGRMGKCVVHSLRDFEVRGTGTEVEILNINGRGLLHSFQLAMRNPETGGQYMEGNIEMYVDGETKSSYASSGTEEFFYGGIYFINPFWTPDGGCTLSIHEPNNTDKRSSAYRIFAKDPVTFDKSLRIVWHNGQQGQGDVPGTTVVDSQTVVYLQKDSQTETNPIDLSSIAQRLSMIDGDPELGPMVTENFSIEPIHPDNNTTICKIKGAGHLCKLQLSLEGVPEQVSSAHLIIMRDGEKICDEPLYMLFGTGKTALDFTTDFVGQTALLNNFVHLQRDLLIPHSELLIIQISSNKNSGIIKGSGVIERRIARDGIPSDFGQAQAPLFLYNSVNVNSETKTYNLISTTAKAKGQVNEISISISGLKTDKFEIPGKILLECDGEKIALWSPQELVAGLDDKMSGAYVISGAVCIREKEKWSALVSLKNLPISFEKNINLKIDSSDMPKDAKVEAHILIGRKEKSKKRIPSLNEVQQRLTAIDGGVLSGRAICRTVLEDGEIDPGKSVTLLDLAGYGTLRCIRIGTPGSALALRRSQLSITTSSTDTNPTVVTPTDHFFATWFDPFPFWKGAENIVRPTQLHNPSGIDHTSAFRLLNLPFDGRCRVVLSAPKDESGVMEWLKKNMPGKSPREAIRSGNLPENIHKGLLQCADVGLFVQAYANRLEQFFDRGRWSITHIICVEGVELSPGNEITLANIKGQGILQSLQVAFENEESPIFKDCSFEIFIDDESKPSWIAPNLNFLFLGTPLPGSGEGKQTWADSSTRGRDAKGAGNRLMSLEAGTTIFTSNAPYRFGGIRNFNLNAIPFNKSIKIICRHPKNTKTPTKVWSLAMISTERYKE